MKLRPVFLVLPFLLLTWPRGAESQTAAPSPALVLGSDDIRIEQRTDGGYHLFVRAKPGIGSVLLTESTSDPNFHTDTYSYRALEWNPINGDEQRRIDGKFIPRASRIWSLIDSSAEADRRFGRAFHIFIPWVVAWGYPWTRNGKVFIADGSFIDIRVFAKPYADYGGGFADNPFMLRVLQRSAAAPAAPSATPAAASPAAPAPAPVPAAALAPAAPPAVAAAAPPAAAPPAAAPPAAAPSAAAASALAAPPSPTAPRKPGPKPKIPAKAQVLGSYMSETMEAFYDLSSAGGGETLLAGNGRELAESLGALFAKAGGGSADIVICLDTTESMQAPLDALRAALPGILKGYFASAGSRRIGLVVYRDYFEEYLTRRVDFVDGAAAFETQLDQVRVAGGRDLPEAAYEGVYAALTEFPWAADTRMIVLLGDAPPHPLPRGRIDRASVLEASAQNRVELDAIALPHPSQDQ